MKKENEKKTVWFIRHAENLSNADENFKSDDFSGGMVPLSKKGIEQAEKLLDIFSDAPDLLITSPYVRTKETARPLVGKYPAIQHEEWPIHEFTYLSSKRCFNTSFLEREVWRDEYWQRNDPLHSDGVGAESFADFMGRVQDAMKNIKARKEKFIVLFSHGYTIAAVRYLLEKKPKEITSEVMRDYKKYFHENKISNTEKFEFIFEE